MSQQDFVSSHADRVCHSINQDHSDAVLAVARFTKQDVASATVVQVSQEGFKMEGKDGQGKSFEMSVSFPGPVHSMAMAKDTFLQMSKQVKTPSTLNPHLRREVLCPIEWLFCSFPVINGAPLWIPCMHTLFHQHPSFWHAQLTYPPAPSPTIPDDLTDHGAFNANQ